MTAALAKVAPGPSGRLLLGSLPEFRRDPLALLSGLRERYGDVARFRLVRDECFLLSHPDHVRYVLRENSTNYRKALFFDMVRVLLGDGLLSWPFEDAFWRQRRRLCSPPFRPRSLRKFAEIWAVATNELIDRWRGYAHSGEVFDAFEQTMAHSLDLAARTLFSLDAGSADGELVTSSFTICLQHLMYKVGTVVNVPESVPTPRNRRFLKARGALDEVVYRLIRERREAGDRAPDDFLSSFVQANDSDPAHRVSDRQLRDDLLTLFIAGFETNASALAFALWVLAQHPDWAARVREEVQDVLDKRDPGYDDLGKLTCNHMTLLESMRLYPPAWWLTRAAIEDDEIGGFRVPAGATVIVSQWVTQRHPDYWTDAETFDPLRFTAERSSERPALAYFPFGDGPRSCIGEQFAMVQLEVVLAMLVRAFEFQPQPDHDIGVMPLITMRPRNPVLISLREAGPRAGAAAL